MTNHARTRRVAVVMPVGNAHGREVFKGIAAYARRLDPPPFNIEWTDIPPREGFASWRVDGLIIAARKPEAIELLRRADMPVVNVASYVPESGLTTVCIDNVAVGRLAASHLLERGFTRLAALGIEDVALSNDRLRGFREVAESAGARCDSRTVDRVRMNEYERLGQLSDLSAWLTALRRPVGVFTMHDRAARVIVEACHRVGLRVPEDVAVLGVDNDELLCETARPPLSSVEPEVVRVGYEAAALLVRLMDGAAPPREPVRVQPVRVFGRQSTDILAVEDAEVAAALRYINEHATESMGVDDILAHVPVNRRTLERKFRRHIKRSPHAEIQRVRIERAKQTLATTNWPLARVARACGFRYAAHLATAFRREAGMSPSEYRGLHRL